MTSHEWDVAPMHALPTHALPNFYDYWLRKGEIHLSIKLSKSILLNVFR